MCIYDGNLNQITKEEKDKFIVLSMVTLFGIILKILCTWPQVFQ